MQMAKSMFFPLHSQITKSYRDRDVLTNATWEVKQNERVGLVGKPRQAVSSRLWHSTAAFPVALVPVQVSYGTHPPPGNPMSVSATQILIR